MRAPIKRIDLSDLRAVDIGQWWSTDLENILGFGLRVNKDEYGPTASHKEDWRPRRRLLEHGTSCVNLWQLSVDPCAAWLRGRSHFFRDGDSVNCIYCLNRRS